MLPIFNYKKFLFFFSNIAILLISLITFFIAILLCLYADIIEGTDLIKFIAVDIFCQSSALFVVGILGIFAGMLKDLRFYFAFMTSVCTMALFSFVNMIIMFWYFFYKLEFSTESAVKKAMENYKDNPEGMNGIQTNLRCCGGSSPSDWEKMNITKYPISCLAPSCAYQTLETKDGRVYYQGCIVAFTSILQGFIIFFFIVIMFELLMQSIGFFASLNFIQNKKQAKLKYRRKIFSSDVSSIDTLTADSGLYYRRRTISPRLIMLESKDSLILNPNVK